MKIIPAHLLKGSVLAASVMAANVVNLLFNAFVGRVLSTEDFGVLALVNTFLFFLNLFCVSLTSVTNREVSYLDSHISKQKSNEFFASITRQIFIASIFISLIWFLSVPFLSRFFQINNLLTLYSFTPILILYPLAFLGRGYLQGRLLFILAAFTVLVEPIIKLISAFLILNFNLPSFVYLSIYISAALTGIITIFLIIKKLKLSLKNAKVPFPYKFFAAGLLTGASTISFLSLDILLVKHFMTPTEAGQYAFLSLLGKIIFFLGSVLNIFTITLITRESKNQKISFYLLFSAAAVLTLVGVFIFGTLGFISIPLIFGEKAIPIISLSLPYLFAITIFTLSNIIVTFHLARKEYLFPILSAFSALILTFGITIYHQTLTQVVYVILTVGLIYTLVLTLFHIRQNFFAPKVAVKPLQHTQEGIIYE